MKSKLIILSIICASIFTLISCDAKLVGIVVVPKNHNFGEVQLGNSANLVLQIRNMATETVSIANVRISGIAAADYSIMAGVSFPRSINGGSFFSMTIIFEPQLAGLRNATVMIYHNGYGPTREIGLTGTGRAVPKIEITPTSHDYGVNFVSLHADQDFEVKNIGTANLTLGSMIFTTNMTEYSIISGGATPVNIQPGATHTVTIRFAPTKAGVLNSTFEIAHNAVNTTSPSRIQLRAEGTLHSPEIVLNKTAPWDFGQVTSNNTLGQDIEISNTGNSELSITGFTTVTNTYFKVGGFKSSTGGVITLPLRVPVGDFIKATINFTPTTTGNYNDTLRITHDATNESSPLDLSLVGSGKTPIVTTYNYTGNVINWTVPAGVTQITIEAWGGQGGDNIALNNLGGKGARMKGDFNVTPGQTLRIVVGQQGIKATSGNTANGAGGGGGGSFVWLSTSTTYPLIAAGGGGASCLTNNGAPHYHGKDGVITESGSGSRSHDRYTNSPGGTNGNDGKTVSQSGGKGWNSIKNNPAGDRACRYGGDGGYGGGGGCGCAGPGNYIHAGGGGGGYSGGGAGGTAYYFGGGGGGSYNSGSSTSNSAGVKTGNGQIQITH